MRVVRLILGILAVLPALVAAAPGWAGQERPRTVEVDLSRAGRSPAQGWKRSMGALKSVAEGKALRASATSCPIRTRSMLVE